MPSPIHFPPQPLGSTVDYDVDVSSATGANVAFAGTEPLSCEVIPFQGGAAISSPTITWTTPASGIARITLFADPDLFLAGYVYRVLGDVEVSGSPRPIFPADCFVSFTPAPSNDTIYKPAQKINSSHSPYCTVEEFLRHVDRDLVGRLVRDDGGVDTGTELNFDAVLEEILLAASGEIESACTRGEFYSPEDLAALSASGGAGAAQLRSLVSATAIYLLRMRRGHSGSAPLPQEQWAMDRLDALARGARIFPFAPVQRAGRPSHRFISAEARAEVGYLTDDERFWGRRTSNRSGY